MLEENRFENVLASLRTRKGWTQEDAAAHLGVVRHTYSDWETGKRIPTPKQLKHIAATFKLSQEDVDTLYRAAAHVPPKIHNLPFPRNPFFTGRTAHLEQLGQLFQENASVALTQPIGISGLGGIGKAQLALEYAHRCYPNVYRAVFWVNAADKSALQASFDHLAQCLELPERNEQELDQRVQAVKRWLERYTNWLLIMDNADDLQLARSFFPVEHHGHILLTTRSQIVGNIARQVEVEELPTEEALLFILRRSGNLQGAAQPDAVAVDIREAATQLVELLGRHPLALDQAGAYLEETGVSFTDYINLYYEEHRFLLLRRGSLGGDYSEHPETVAATFELSFKKACERHPIAADILHFCAFLEPDAIPEELFQYEDSLRLDVTAFNEGIAALHHFSLIKRNAQEKTLSMHRLVQIVLLDLVDIMPPDLQSRLVGRIGRALNAAFPLPDFKNWTLCDRFLSHVLVYADLTENDVTPVIEVGDLFYKAGFYVHGRRWYSMAETLLLRSLSSFAQHAGDCDRGTMFIRSGLASVYSAQERYEEAETILLQMISAQTEQLVLTHPDTLLSTDSLAILYMRQHKYDQAESVYMRLLALLKKRTEDGEASDIDATLVLHNLARIFLNQGKYDQADVLFQQVFDDVQEKHLEADHPTVAFALYGMAMSMVRHGQYEQAKSLYERALHIDERLYGASHPDLQVARERYAEFLHIIGQNATGTKLEQIDESPE